MGVGMCRVSGSVEGFQETEDEKAEKEPQR